MFRATTPTHTFTLEVSTSTCDEILVTYKLGDVVLNKHYEDGTLPDGMTLDNKKVIIKLTQEETLMFPAGKSAEVQLRARIGTDVLATDKFNVTVNSVLNEEILS